MEVVMLFWKGSLVLIAVFSVVGCSSSSPSVRDSSRDSASSQADVEEDGCGAVVRFARACYDEGTANADCESIGEHVQEHVARNGANAKVQQLTGEICQAGCQARKEGYKFSRVSGTIRSALCVASR
jgi:hypothetical protein